MDCPKCGNTNAPEAICCQAPGCGYLLSAPPPPLKGGIASEAPGRPLRVRPPRERESLQPPLRTPLSGAPGGSPSPGYRSEGGGSRSFWRRHPAAWAWALAGALLLGLPIAYAAGSFAAWQPLRQAEAHPRIVHIYSPAIQGTPAPNPSRAAPTRTSREMASPPSSTSASPPASSSSSSFSPKTSASYTPAVTQHQGGALITPAISGTVVNGQLITKVWVSTSATGPRYPVWALVDTGAQHTMISGRFWQAMGDQPYWSTEHFSGIGGVTTAHLWPNVWVWTAAYGQADPILAGTTEPGGLGSDVGLSQEGVRVLLGQDVISRGQLEESGRTWSLAYTTIAGPESPPGP